MFGLISAGVSKAYDVIMTNKRVSVFIGYIVVFLAFYAYFHYLLGTVDTLQKEVDLQKGQIQVIQAGTDTKVMESDNTNDIRNIIKDIKEIQNEKDYSYFTPNSDVVL